MAEKISFSNKLNLKNIVFYPLENKESYIIKSIDKYPTENFENYQYKNYGLNNIIPCTKNTKQDCSCPICKGWAAMKKIAIKPPVVFPIDFTNSTYFPSISIKENAPPPPKNAIGFDSKDIQTIAHSLVEAMNDPQAQAELKEMNPTEMTGWIASKIGKPVITATQVKGKVIFKEPEVLVATPEEIAAFERDFMM